MAASNTGSIATQPPRCNASPGYHSKVLWTEGTVGELLTLQRGFDITKEQQRTGTVPVVSSGGISSFHDTAMVKAPGVVIGRKGTLGTTFYLEKDFWPHDTTLWVKDFKGNDPRFAYYFLKAFESDFLAMDNGTANPTLNRNHVHPLPAIIPPLPEQRAIARILGTLDDKIELNRKMNRTLEELTQALFRSWFVDFDPVVAKSEGRKPYGMDEATAALFPSGFQDSELGRIPLGWGVHRLSELGSWASGGTPSKNNEHYWGGDVPWISAKSMHHFCIQESEDRVTAIGANNGTKLVPAGTTLFVVRGMSLADEFRVGLTDRPVTFNQDLKAIVPNSSVPSPLVALFLLSLRETILDLADEASHGTKRLKTELVERLPLALPPVPTRKRLSGELSKLCAGMFASRNEVRGLAATRDTLLPKLLSGEIRLKQAEQIVEKTL